MAILAFKQRHDLGKATLFCQSKMYSALYVHPDFPPPPPPPPYYLLPYITYNTEVSQYIEKDMI